VEGSDVTVDVSSPATYIDSHDNSVPSVVSSVDGIGVSNDAAAAAFSHIHPSDVLISCNASAAEATFEQTGPSALAADLTTSPELPVFKSDTTR